MNPPRDRVAGIDGDGVLFFLRSFLPCLRLPEGYQRVTRGLPEGAHPPGDERDRNRDDGGDIYFAVVAAVVVVNVEMASTMVFHAEFVVMGII